MESMRVPHAEKCDAAGREGGEKSREQRTLGGTDKRTSCSVSFGLCVHALSAEASVAVAAALPRRAHTCRVSGGGGGGGGSGSSSGGGGGGGGGRRQQTSPSACSVWPSCLDRKTRGMLYRMLVHDGCVRGWRVIFCAL
jgi:hypothetical protein